MTSKAEVTKAKKKKMDYIYKLKSFYIAKEANNKMKKHPIVWEKTSANPISDKGQPLKYIKHSTQLSSKKQTNNPITKWAEDLFRHFSKEDIQMADRYTKRCSASLLIREMHIQTTMRYHFTPVGMAGIQKPRTKCW